MLCRILMCLHFKGYVTHQTWPTPEDSIHTNGCSHYRGQIRITQNNHHWPSLSRGWLAVSFSHPPPPAHCRSRCHQMLNSELHSLRPHKPCPIATCTCEYMLINYTIINNVLEGEGIVPSVKNPFTIANVTEEFMMQSSVLHQWPKSAESFQN